MTSFSTPNTPLYQNSSSLPFYWTVFPSLCIRQTSPLCTGDLPLLLLNKFSHAIIFNVSQNHQFLPPHWNSPISIHICCHISHLNRKWVFSLAHIALERLPHLFIPFPARAYTFLAPIFLIIHSSKTFLPSHQWNHSCHSHQHSPSCLIQMWIQSPLLTWPLSSIRPRWHSPSGNISYLLGHHTLSGVYTYITDHFFIF